MQPMLFMALKILMLVLSSFMSNPSLMVQPKLLIMLSRYNIFMQTHKFCSIIFFFFLKGSQQTWKQKSL